MTLNKLHRLFLVIAAIWAFAAGSPARQALAQGTAQVIVSGIPPVLASPYLSDLERTYRLGRFPVQFIYTSPSRLPRDFRFQLSLDVNGERLIDMISEPVSYEPGIHVYRTFDDEPAIRFPLSYGEWIAMLDASVDETGLLPEGDYMLTIEPIVEDENALIPTLPGIAMFAVQYAEPPLLLTPFDQANLTNQFPVFSWTPVSGTPLGSTIEYELLIVEVFQQQTPYQALEGNPELVREVLTEQTSFVYSFEELPLEKGKTYAWQVRARDISDRLPVLDRGETEFYTFTVGAEGLGSMLTSWSYPVNDPFIYYEFENTLELDPSDTEIYFDGLVPIRLNELSGEAQFNQLLIDAETQTIIEGSLTLNDPFALEVQLDPLSDQFTGYTAVPAGSPLTLKEGLLLEMGSGIVIDAEGLHPRGTHPAVVSYAGQEPGTWNATYSQDFVFSLSPFNVVSGRVDFAANGVAMAYADPSGFHVTDRSDPVIARLPDRIVIPSGDLAYVPLKRNGAALVDVETDENGVLRLRQRPGAGLELVVPAFSSSFSAEPQRFPAVLDAAVIDAGSGALIGGAVEAEAPAGETFTLDALGIPVAPSRLISTRIGDAPALSIEGRLSLFGRPVRNTAPITLTLDAAGVVSGQIDLEDTDGLVYLDPAETTAALHLAAANGQIRVPLRTHEPAAVRIDAAGRFAVHAEDETLTEADIAFRYSGDGSVELTSFAPTPPERAAAFALKDRTLRVDGIESLSLSYAFDTGIRYTASLASTLQMLPDGPSLVLPLNQVELREYGFLVPEQELHEGVAAFTPQSVSLHDVRLTLIGARIPAGIVDLTSTATAALDPYLDFAADLEAASLTLQDARLRDGAITGAILPYRFEEPAAWPFDAGDMLVASLTGGLNANGLHLNLIGSFALQPPAGASAARCVVPGMQLRIENGRPVEGASDTFTPCDQYRVGDFQARLNDAVLRVAPHENDTVFVLDGSLAALQGLGSAAASSANGDVVLDIVNQTFVEARADIPRLSWLFPVDAPLYQLELEDAVLTGDGFSAAHDSAFSATSLADNAAYRLRPDAGFTLGIRPAHANAGQASLVARSDGRQIGQFDGTGFAPSTPAASAPTRITLPGSYGAYLDIATADPEGFDRTPGADGGFVFKTAPGRSVSLILPSMGAPGNHPALPVSVDLRLTDSNAYAGGAFTQNFAAAPIDLEPFGYPLRILSVTYDPARAAGERLELEAALNLPPVFGLQTSAAESLLLNLALTPTGFEAAPFRAPAYAFYNNTLSLDVDRVRLPRGAADGVPVTISGQIGGPVFGDDANLRYSAVYSPAEGSWTMEIDASAQTGIALNQATLWLDPHRPATLTTDPALVLELTGSMHMPASIGDGFSLGVTMEIGPGGVYVWPYGSFSGPQPLFGGFLTAHLDAVDLAYDAERRAVVATLDGAFSTRLTSNGGTGIERAFSERLPFTAMRLGTDGRAELEGDRGGVSSIDLLSQLPSITVIDQVLRVERLEMDAGADGLHLDIGGIAQLPNPSMRLQRVTPRLAGGDSSAAVTYTDRIPLTIRLDGQGQMLAPTDAPWTPRLFQDDTSPPESPGDYRFAAAYLDFSLRHPSRSALYIASGLYIASDDETAPLSRLAFGEAWNPRGRPGLVLRQNEPRYYHLAQASNTKRPSLKIQTPLARIDATAVTLADPSRPTLLIGGRAHLRTRGISGFLPVERLLVGPSGISDPGRAAGPAQLAFDRLAAFEVGCFEHVAPVLGDSDALASPIMDTALLRTVDACNAAPRITLTDRWLAGSYERFFATRDTMAQTGLELRGARVDLSGLASLSATLSYDPDADALAINGITRFRGIDYSSFGRLKTAGDTPGLQLSFSPGSRPIEMLPGLLRASTAGGGIFLRPTQEDMNLVLLALNERSNNQFSSNTPHAGDLPANRLTALLPVDVRMETPADSSLMHGIGLLTATPQFVTLDIDAHYFDMPDELSAGMFLLERPYGDNGRSLEGVSNISLNYPSFAGGIVKTNFYARGSNDTSPVWTSYGLSHILLYDTVALPGRFMMTGDGVVMDLHDTARLKQGLLALENDLNVTLWQNRSSGQLGAYSAFDASIDLIPGYALSTVKLYGGSVEDREERLLFAANNMFADVPYVYTGPIDPWLSMQDGAVNTGDARNTTFRRMISDARSASANVNQLARDVTQSLAGALDVQTNVLSSLSGTQDLSFFAQPDSLMRLAGSRVWADETRALAAAQTPAIFETIQQQLFEDETRPDYGLFPGQPPASAEAMEAWIAMQTSVGAARRSAQTDMFSFESLAARPLLWSSDHIELISEIKTSPIQSIAWPLQSGRDTDVAPGFTVAPNVSQFQRNNLLAFKQNNEALDVQFLRAVNGLELNLVNLKITRSPEQAADFTRAISQYERFASRQIADDWTLLDWTENKIEWLQSQENAVDRGVRDLLRAYSSLENSDDAMRAAAERRFAAANDVAQRSDWKRDDLPENQSYSQYLASLDGPALEEEFATTARDLWFEAPLAALTGLRDTLSTVVAHRVAAFETGRDTLKTTYSRFTRALDPLYDTQTRYTALLYGMAEEYWQWRSSIRRLDPEAVNFAFQFVPYRGNYRILAEDLAPPLIEEIRVSTTNQGFLSRNTISWDAEHPVAITENSLSIVQDSVASPRFGSASESTEIDFYTAKPNEDTVSRTVNVTLRVRGAGGVPAVKRGQFVVAVDPAAGLTETGEERPLVPTDATPPPAPAISNLAYSSYFTDTPNTLAFYIDALRDDESGIADVSYRIVNDRNRDDVLQDWTGLQKSTEYFPGRRVETSLPVQENDVTVRVFVRTTNRAGLTSESSASLALDLDDSPPTGSIARLSYFNAFDIEHPNALRVELSPLRDAESGIDNVEYTFLRNAQANLANAVWRPLTAVDKRLTEWPAQSFYLDLDRERLPEQMTSLSMFVRITNGAGLQTVANQAVQIPPRDQTPPTEPVVSLEHSGFYRNEAPNRLRIIVSGSQDLESGIASVSYRVIDGATGVPISDWDDVAYLDPNVPTYIFPATEKSVDLPDFDRSRSVLVEVQAANRAGLASALTVAFIQLDLDMTPPSTPTLEAIYRPAYSAGETKTLALTVGRSEDPESPITDVAYRFIDRTTRRILTDWTPLIDAANETAIFPGLVMGLDAAMLPAQTDPEVQVRVTNASGLQSVAAAPVRVEGDTSPPSTPTLALSLEREASTARISLDIGPSYDAQSGISAVRYRIRNPQQAGGDVVSWSPLRVNAAWGSFAGQSVSETVEALPSSQSLIADVEITNGAGQTTTVSGIIDRQLAELTLPAPPHVEAFYFSPSNTIQSGELEFTLTPDRSRTSQIDSVHYRVSLVDETGISLIPAARARWQRIALDPDEGAVTRFSLPELDGSATAVIDLRLSNALGQSLTVRHRVGIPFEEDDTPPTQPVLDVRYSGYYHPQRANQLDVFVDGLSDPESRIARAAYRIVNDADTSEVFADWTPLSNALDRGLLAPASIPVSLPDFERSVTLRVEVAAVNGVGLARRVHTIVPVVVDATPPELPEPMLTLSDLYDPHRAPVVGIDFGEILDAESMITELGYRISSGSDSTERETGWTVVETAASHRSRIPSLVAPVQRSLTDQELHVEARAINAAGLEVTKTGTLRIEADRSAPQMPTIALSYRNSPIGGSFIQILPGTFRDVESQIAAIEYRIVRASNASDVLIDWVSVPVPREDRVAVQPIAVPRERIPFAGALDVVVVFRATNGAGLSQTTQATVAIPGDVTPPETPGLLAEHRNAYDPLNPNTIEIQIGSTDDDQSSIASVRYRIVEPASGREFAGWTSLDVSRGGFFPGTVLFEELPLLQNNTRLRVDLEVVNSAGLASTASTDVQVDIATDVTPPEASIALHYFATEVALVLEELADPESKIQQVEYRFLDNVDQSELLAWTNLFEIAVPQASYSRQSYKVQQPETSSERTLKVEVRVTNGAGLQTTVSKTVLFRQPGLGQE